MGYFGLWGQLSGVGDRALAVLVVVGGIVVIVVTLLAIGLLAENGEVIAKWLGIVGLGLLGMALLV